MAFVKPYCSPWTVGMFFCKDTFSHICCSDQCAWFTCNSPAWKVIIPSELKLSLQPACYCVALKFSMVLRDLQVHVCGMQAGHLMGHMNVVTDHPINLLQLCRVSYFLLFHTTTFAIPGTALHSRISLIAPFFDGAFHNTFWRWGVFSPKFVKVDMYPTMNSAQYIRHWYSVVCVGLSSCTYVHNSPTCISIRIRICYPHLLNNHIHMLHTVV